MAAERARLVADPARPPQGEARAEASSPPASWQRGSPAGSGAGGGGAGGRRPRVGGEDGRSEPATAARIYEKLITKMDLNTVFGAFKVDTDGVQIAHKMLMLQWQGGRKGRLLAE